MQRAGIVGTRIGAELIRWLREHSIAVSLDRIGIGYASLSYLRHFAFDSLKIDCSLVFDVHQCADSATIVWAIIALAKSFKLAVIAEGVENSSWSLWLPWDAMASKATCSARPYAPRKSRKFFFAPGASGGECLIGACPARTPTLNIHNSTFCCCQRRLQQAGQEYLLTGWR